MVMTYDVKNQKVGVVSIPRDTLVDRASGNPKLVYGPGGVKQRAEDISDMLGIPIDRYIQVNIKGFIALVDYLEGVDFYVPCDMDYDDPYQDLFIHFKQGQQHLNGQQAMEVARFRKNNDGSGYTDVGRTQNPTEAADRPGQKGAGLEQCEQDQRLCGDLQQVCLHQHGAERDDVFRLSGHLSGHRRRSGDRYP